jgi:exonuclease-1
MGICGLLKFLSEIIESIHISSFFGQVLAVDTYSWLHKACSCNVNCVTYCMDRIYVLRQHAIIPIMVFDGKHLPMKEGCFLCDSIYVL